MMAPGTDRATIASALVAFAALPGIVGFAVPLGIAARQQAVIADSWALGLVVLGSLLLTSCIRSLFVSGHGTLGPWDPPRQLVTTGPYRWCRNPMYIAVLTVVSGWTAAYGSAALAAYTAALAIAFHLRVVLVEEPWAARAFGGAWTTYRISVSRWRPQPPTKT